jgi:hypothetical protein
MTDNTVSSMDEDVEENEEMYQALADSDEKDGPILGSTQVSKGMRRHRND